MPLVSITRLRLRRFRYMPAFAWHSMLSARQASRMPGFFTGWLSGNPLHRTFWTATVWENEAAMRAFRGSGAHQRAMRKLFAWCDEASVAHWEQPGIEAPDANHVLAPMQAMGRLLRVQYPSSDHAAGRIAADGRPPLRGSPLRANRNRP